MSRVRKAYSLAMRGYEREPSTIYAPSAAKAKAEFYSGVSDAWDISWRVFLRELAWCRRSPERDMALPEPHPLARSLDPSILHCVVHAHGGKGLKAGYRDHFYASDDDWEMKAAFYHGLFEIHRKDKGRGGRCDMVMYQLTAMGKNVAAGEAETYPRFWS